MQKIPRFFARNRNLCNFGLYFFWISLPWQLPWFAWKLW